MTNRKSFAIEVRVVAALKGGKMTNSLLADFIGVSRQTMVHRLRHMVRHGVLDRLDKPGTLSPYYVLRDDGLEVFAAWRALIDALPSIRPGLRREALHTPPSPPRDTLVAAFFGIYTP